MRNKPGKLGKPMQTAEDVSEGTGNAKCKYQTCPYFLLCRNGCALSLARVENPAFRAIGAVSGRLEVANGKADWLEAATASGRGRPARLMSEHSVLETEPCQESNGRLSLAHDMSGRVSK